MKALKAAVEGFVKIESEYKDLKDIVSIATAEDASSLEHFKKDLANLKLKIDTWNLTAF